MGDNNNNNNLSFLQNIVQDLLKAKHTNYSEQCIPYYLDQQLLTIEDLPKVTNRHHQKLKCTLVRHRRDKHLNKMQKGTEKCVIYLHGLGSSRLQALNIAQNLPRQWALCMFDMSGSGKSQGEHVTYGLKEQEDIEPLINYLHKKKHIKEFVLWGRSMGAVATLLYSQENYPGRKPSSSNGQSLRNSLIHSHSASRWEEEGPLIKAIVLDSPFHNFKDIAKEIAVRKMNLPHFLLDIGLNYVEESFQKMLKESIGVKYNPFKINFDSQISLRIPLSS